MTETPPTRRSSWPLPRSAPTRPPSPATSSTIANASSTSPPPIRPCARATASRSRSSTTARWSRPSSPAAIAGKRKSSPVCSRGASSSHRAPANCTRAACPPAQTLRCLTDEPAGRFLYQPTLVPPPLFYERYGIDPELVVLSDNHPDLVEILADEDGGRLLRVDRCQARRRPEADASRADPCSTPWNCRRSSTRKGSRRPASIWTRGRSGSASSRSRRSSPWRVSGRTWSAFCATTWGASSPASREDAPLAPLFAAASGASSSTTAATRCAAPTTCRAWSSSPPTASAT